jgi:hypothetical protein
MSKKIALALLTFVFVSSNAFATYHVVLKNGTRYRAQEKWSVVNGKALILLETGTTLQIDPAMIDVKATSDANTSGYGDAKLIATTGVDTTPKKSDQPSLGTITRNMSKKGDDKATTAVTGSRSNVREAPVPGQVGAEAIARFEAAYENMGLFQRRVTPNGGASIRVEVVTDNEDQVFKAISATSYVMAKLPTVTKTRLDTVELVLTTLRGAPAGRFTMTAEDAAAIDSRKMTWSQYFVEKVIF